VEADTDGNLGQLAPAALGVWQSLGDERVMYRTTIKGDYGLGRFENAS
jgi:hypothetical protein